MIDQMTIGGEWVDSESGERFDVFSPVTGEKIGSVPEGTREDVRRAVAAAGAAWPAWAARSAFERAAVLERAAALVHERREAMARLLTIEQGKPLAAEAYDEVDALAEYFRMSAADGLRLEGHLLPSKDPHKRVLVSRVPRGVVGVISPWNWPYTMPGELIAPALAAGNAVVWACAPSTPFCAIALAACLVDAGLPAGLLNLVTGPGPVVGDEIAAHPGTHAVGFIGSVATGRIVAGRAAGKDLLLELGGNGPQIIFEDADLERAVAGTLLGSFLCAGQSCSASELVLVHERVKDDYMDRLLAAVRANIRLGDPFAPETTMGPLNNEKTAAKMDAHLADARALGAGIVAGGRRAPGFPTPLYYEPTVLDRVDSRMQIARDETFGPVVPVQTFAGDEDALRLAAASGFGLSVALYTQDIGRGWRLAERIRAGTVVLNDSTNWFEDHIPFGGGAGTQSGFGRVGGRFGLERFTETRTIFVDLS